MKSRTDTVLQSSVSCTQNQAGHGTQNRHSATKLSTLHQSCCFSYWPISAIQRQNDILKSRYLPQRQVTLFLFIQITSERQHTQTVSLLNVQKLKYTTKATTKFKMKRSHSNFSPKGTNPPWKDFFFTVFWSSFFSQCWQSTLFPFFISQKLSGGGQC